MTQQAGQTQYDSGQYITSNEATTSQAIEISGVAAWDTVLASYSLKHKTGISPQLYFKYVKKKFGILERVRIDARLKKLEKAFNKAVENGQEALGMKLMSEMARETRESLMYAKGIRHFIDHGDLHKHKRSIRDGHISDTKFADFTRKIPDYVLAKKKKVEELFDGFVIYHYWNEAAEKKRTEKQKMSQQEKDRMRDPVLFGVIRESNRLYFIAEWDDEYCDLSFEELIDVIGKEEKKDDEQFEITREPKLNV